MIIPSFPECKRFIIQAVEKTYIFSDTAPIIYLAKNNLLEISLKTFSFFIPEEVEYELFPENRTDHPETNEIKEYLNNKNINVTKVKPTFTELNDDYLLAIKSLKGGEKAVFELFLTIKKGFVLTDDYSLINICNKYSIPFTSTILMPLLLWNTNKIPLSIAFEALDKIAKTGYYEDKISTFTKKLLADISKAEHK